MCGFCQNGMMIKATELLEQTPSPTLAQIKNAFMSGPSPHLCRCGTYSAIIDAVQRAAVAHGEGEVSGDACNDQQRLRRHVDAAAFRPDRGRAARRRQPDRQARLGGTPASAAGRNTLDATLASSWFEIHADNTILMRTGKADFGQSTAHTAYRQIVAEELNVPFEAITTVVMGDTDRTPDGGFSAGSSSTAERTSGRPPPTPTRPCSISPRRSWA